MTQKAKRNVTVVLCAIMTAMFLLPTLSACNDSTKDTQYVYADATRVQYSSDGLYTTTVTAADANIPSDIGAGAITVEYTSSAPDESETKRAQTQSVTRKDEHTLEVTFKDGEASTAKPIGYDMTIVTKSKRGKAQKAAFAYVGVDYPQYTVTPNLSSVSALDEELTLTLELDESTYKDDVSAEDITLTGAFKKLKIERVSSANKNLTLYLTGDPKYRNETGGAMYRDESDGSYHNGGVKIAASAVNDSMYDIEASIPVEDVSFVFDASGLKMQGDIAEIPVYLYGYAFGDAAASDFVFKQIDINGTYDENAGQAAENAGQAAEVKYQYKVMQGVNVIGFDKADGDASHGILRVQVDGADSENEVAAKLSGNILTVAGHVIGRDKDLDCSVTIDPASFYAVFDYAEEVGGNYNFTLILNASNGTFNDNIKKSDISFSDDFVGAEVRSFTLTGDKTAELQITLPSNGVKLEDMYLKGTVALAAGSMTNRWGKTSDKIECTRAYDYDTMGRWTILDDAWDTIKDVASTVKDAVTNLDNWGKVFDVGGKIFSGVGAVITVLEFLGVIESAKAKLDKIYNYLQGMHEELVALSAKIDELLRETQSKLNENTITSFYQNKLYMMKEYRGYAVAAIKDAKAALIKENVTQEPNVGMDGDVMHRAAWTDYVKKVFQRVSETDGAIFDKLLELYTSVCGEVSSTMGGKSIVTTFDEYVANYYNFDTQGYDSREEFRNSIAVELHSTYYLLCAYNQFRETPKQNIINSITTQYQNVETYLTKTNAVQRRTDGHFYMYAASKDVEVVKNFTIKTKERPSKERDWFDKSSIKYPMNIDDSTLCSYFTKRMHGGTLADEFKSIGYSDKNVKIYLSMLLSFDDFWKAFDGYMAIVTTAALTGIKLDMTSTEFKYIKNSSAMVTSNFNPNNIQLNTTYTLFENVYYFHAIE